MNNYGNVYFALIKAGVQKDYKDAMLQLVLYTFKTKNYLDVDTKTLGEDFNSLMGFEIPPFPLQDLLSRAIKEGYLEYNKNEGKYEPNNSKIKKSPFMNNITEGKQKFNSLVLDFIKYSKETLKSGFNESEAQKIISNFIEEQGMLVFNEKESYFNDSHKEFVFAKYLNYLYREHIDRFNYVNELIVSRILREYVLYNNGETEVFNDLNVYLDTGFVFRLLGIDSLDRKDAYEDLLKDMKDAGISIKLFSHTLNEITSIISNSIQWIDNPAYSKIEANETTDYFVSHKYSQEDIQLYLTELPEVLKSKDIEIVDLEYPKTLPLGVTDELTYYNNIVRMYSENNPIFDEEEKRYTVEMDARSFFYVDYLSKGINSTDIRHAKNILLTTNVSLAMLSRKMMKSKQNIPFCVTDRFMGVTLWNNKPDKIEETSYNNLLIAIKSAFMPNDAMLDLLNKSLSEQEESGILTHEQCVAIKTSINAHNYLMELTNGDYNRFDEKTPLQILKEMNNEARAKGRIEEREKADKEIQAISDQLSQKTKEADDALMMIDSTNKELIKIKIELALKNLSDSEKEQGQFEKLIETINNKARSYKNKLLICYIVLIIIYVVVGVFVWFNSDKKDYFSLYGFIAPAIGLIITYIYFAFTGKDFNVFTWNKRVYEKRREKLLKKSNIDEDKERLRLKEQSQKIKSEIEQLESML